MTTRRNFLLRVGSSALIVALLGGVSATRAQQNAVGLLLPVVGIGAGQTLRVAVAALPPDPTRGQRCQATLGFLDARTGLPVGTVQRFDLRQGEADFHDVETKVLDLRPGRRSDFVPVLAPSADSAPCQFAYTVLEPRGRAGAASEALEHTAFSIVKLLDAATPKSYTPSVGRSQTLLMTFLRTTQPFDIGDNPPPCDVTVNIRRHGYLIASMDVSPAPGKMEQVSVNGNLLGLSLGETAFLTVEFLPSVVQVTLPGGTPFSVSTHVGCLRSFQMVDNITSWTTMIRLP